MGSSSSVSSIIGSSIIHPDGNNKHGFKHKEEEIVRLMLPVYFIKNHICTIEEINSASSTWSLILNDLSPVYLEKRQDPSFNYSSCIVFFYDTFYTRLFNIHPMSRPLFRNGIKSQGRFLVQMISLALSELDDPEKFNRILIKLAEVHYERGVKGVEYGIVGEVLFYTLKKCLGDKIYVNNIHRIWCKIYSRMISIIVPKAISLELNKASHAQDQRLLNEGKKKIFNNEAVTILSVSSGGNVSSNPNSVSYEPDESVFTPKLKIKKESPTIKSTATHSISSTNFNVSTSNEVYDYKDNLFLNNEHSLYAQSIEY